MIRVYVAGKYNDTDVIRVLRNMREGIHVCVKLLGAGYAPFCPWLDYQYGLMADIPVHVYKAYSLAFLEVCDCIFLLPNWTKSEGALRELERANELGLPSFHSMSQLASWALTKENIA